MTKNNSNKITKDTLKNNAWKLYWKHRIVVFIKVSKE